MKTLIDIQDDIMKELLKESKAKTKKAAVTLAITEFINRKKREKLIADRIANPDKYLKKRNCWITKTPEEIREKRKKATREYRIANLTHLKTRQSAWFDCLFRRHLKRNSRRTNRILTSRIRLPCWRLSGNRH